MDSAEWHVIRPPAPFSITPHFKLFTLRGAPTPGLYENRLFRLLLYQGEGYTPIAVRVRGEPWSPEVSVFGPIDTARKMLRTGFNYREFLERLEEYPKLKSLAQRFAGLRPTRSLSLYTALLECVVKQRISLKAALRIQSRIVLSLGEKATLRGQDFYGHPPPQRLLKPWSLRKLGLTRAKARAISEIAKAEMEGRLPSPREADENPEKVVAELTSIKGVGPWTAQLAVAMVSKGFRVGPASDLAVRRGLSKLLNVKPDSESVEKALKDLKDYAGLIMYLASLEYELTKKPQHKPAPDTTRKR